MSSEPVSKGGHGVSAPSLLAHWRRNERGSTAIEMGFVAVPFLMFLFSIIGYGLHFYTQTLMDHAVETASRSIRTGEAQGSNMTMEQFQDAICNAGTAMLDCEKIRVHVDSGATWADINPTACLNSSQSLADGVTASTSVTSESGGRLTPVVVTVCYEWELAAILPFLALSNMTGGSALIQATAAFRTEPF
jgi:Flp pilus assembly protein TadG